MVDIPSEIGRGQSLLTCAIDPHLLPHRVPGDDGDDDEDGDGDDQYPTEYLVIVRKVVMVMEMFTYSWWQRMDFLICYILNSHDIVMNIYKKPFMSPDNPRPLPGHNHDKEIAKLGVGGKGGRLLTYLRIKTKNCTKIAPIQPQFDAPTKF